MKNAGLGRPYLFCLESKIRHSTIQSSFGKRRSTFCLESKIRHSTIIRLFLQTYLMENAKTERLKKLIKKYEEYKK